jgi:hypothetical protein
MNPRARNVLSGAEEETKRRRVRCEAGQKAPEVHLVEDDDVVEKIAAGRRDESFGDAVLPGTAGGDLFRADAHAADRSGDLVRGV